MIAFKMLFATCVAMSAAVVPVGCFAASPFAENAAPADELSRQNVKVEIPAAPEGYRRPKNWKPVLYPRGLGTLAKEESENQM